ncbi:extracellular solute-binding protein [Anaeromassilibacillus sp. An200]|uniref:extracellular solute-binding protein n=1 Tax=Anaeromassilibacillus sp. An200 TaxID=1965587 RepID=UPI000B396C0B|nr:extracellular solute-binding protein [Anaeromassilibacillus sp. An200]OUP13164.1 hypothetical protein B5F35_05245 [Anaeromassilibacillus sp. An200]
MKKIKQMLSIFLLSTLVLSSAACAAEQSGTSQPAGNSTDTSQQSGDTGNMNAEGLPILKEADTFKIAVSKAALCMNTFAEKECTVETEKATNVKIEWMEIPASGWTEKTNIMLASGDLPDAFLGTIDVANNLPSLAELDTAIEQYAPAIQELFEARPDVREASIASDGKIHSLPIGDETYNNKAADQLWINKRWLDQVGKEIPSTTDEFAEVLRAFKAEDPNGNGQADEIPLSMQGVSRIGNLFGSFGALDNNSHVVTIDGKVMFTPTLDGFYQGLQWLNGLSSEGLLDPETFTQNEEQFNSKFKGKDILGAVIAFDPSIVVGAEMINDYVAVPPLKGPNGDQMWNDTGNISSTGFSITVKCEQPEVLVRWYDYIRSDFEVALLWNRGPKGVAWDYTEDGKWMVVQDERPEDIPYGQWRHTISAGGSAPFFFQSELAGPDGQEFTTDRDIMKVEAVESYLPYMYKGLPDGLDDVENANQRAILLVDIDNYLKKFTSSAILDGINEAGWDAHLKTCESLKTAEYEKLCQNFVDRIQG